MKHGHLETKSKSINILFRPSAAFNLQITDEFRCNLAAGHKTVTMGVSYRCPNITKESNEDILNATGQFPPEISQGMKINNVCALYRTISS